MLLIHKLLQIALEPSTSKECMIVQVLWSWAHAVDYKESKERGCKLVTERLKKKKPTKILFGRTYNDIYSNSSMLSRLVAQTPKLFLKSNTDMLEAHVAKATYGWWKTDEQF